MTNVHTNAQFLLALFKANRLNLAVAESSDTYYPEIEQELNLEARQLLEAVRLDLYGE